MKTEGVGVMTMSNRGLFISPAEVNLRLMTGSGQFFELFRDFIHVHLICKFLVDPVKTEQDALVIKSNKGFFQQSRGRNSKINNWIWPVCELAGTFRNT